MKQMKLDHDSDHGISPANGNGSSIFSDPAFASNKTKPIHRWVPWIAGFSGEFVREILDKYATRESVILDPFSGVGTTLVESSLHGNNSIGFEINQYAALAAQTKANAHKIDQKSLRRETSRFHEFALIAGSAKRDPLRKPPKWFKSRVPFYSPRVLRKVLFLLDFIDTIEDQEIRDLFKLAFASTMVTYSNYSYEPSLSTKRSAGKHDVIDYPVFETIMGKLTQMCDDIIWFQNKMKSKNLGVSSRIIVNSFFNAKGHISNGEAHVVITSPPYLNNYHYNRNTRPQLFWLGLIDKPDQMKPLEQNNFGNYWQTVREMDDLQLNFELPELDQLIEAIRQKNPDRGIYGGHGWANYATSYFNDCYRFADSLDYALSERGIASIVIGNSIIQGIGIPTDRYLGRIAELAGLKLVGIEVLREKRAGNSIINSNVRVGSVPNGRLYEAVVILRK